MSSTETPSAPPAQPIDLSASTHLNSAQDAILSGNLPWRQKQDLFNFVQKLKWSPLPASAAQELLELLSATTDALALALSSAGAIGPRSPSPKDSQSPTSAETAGAPADETGALTEFDDDDVLRDLMQDVICDGEGHFSPAIFRRHLAAHGLTLTRETSK